MQSYDIYVYGSSIDAHHILSLLLLSHSRRIIHILYGIETMYICDSEWLRLYAGSYIYVCVDFFSLLVVFILIAFKQG